VTTPPKAIDLRHVVAAVSAALAQPPSDDSLAAVFERQVQQLLSMRAVRLREIPARYQARLVTPTRTAESIVLGVPTSNPHVQAVLEARFDRGRTLGEHDFELLTAAAQLGGLVLEATRTRPADLPMVPGAVSPLIGSSAVMAALKERVERVATTDFTVLIEGSIDHEHQKEPS
jgi:hypothetical protein